MKIKRYLIAGSIIFALGLIIMVCVILQPGFSYNSSKYPAVEKIDKYEEVLHIDFEGNAEDLHIEYTEDSCEVITYNSEVMWYDVNYDSTTKTLSIEQDTKPVVFIFGKNNRVKPVVIKVNSDLVSVDIDVDAADVSFNNVTIKRLNVNVDAGKVSFTNCNVSDAIIEVDAGEVLYTGKIINRFECNVDVGSIELNLTQKQEEFKVNGSGEGNIIVILDVDLGSHNVKYSTE